ncbi:hypothetical protein CJ030_MR8G023496 [Morella rubra]|uniref:Uncharacterized protein n=1 Tax=Morella rubra TaxID=262757 RepID=A0A6A1URK6_9ROSI|nr:hypothetical protein CJ030_MR8G023496 [Morella rubra]
MVPKIALLRQIGALESTISHLVTNFPSVAFMKHDRFVEAVQRVMEMGFNPLKVVFILAVQVLAKMSEPRLGSRFELCKRWSWPKDVVLLAFKRYSNCMLSSDEKIKKTMDILVNKMGWPSTDIARYPTVVCFSLERSIMPRCSVMEILLAKDLVKSDLCLATFMLLGERYFLDKYVIEFQDRVPELFSIYKDKMELLDVGI